MSEYECTLYTTTHVNLMPTTWMAAQVRSTAGSGPQEQQEWAECATNHSPCAPDIALH